MKGAILLLVTDKALDRQYQPGRTVDVSRIVLSPARAQRRYGWCAATPLLVGLEHTWAWRSSQ